jgi:ribosomal-protein-serine acetyltransferase
MHKPEGKSKNNWHTTHSFPNFRWQAEGLHFPAVEKTIDLATITIDEHIVLRPFVPADADALFSAIDGSRPHLGPWLNWVGGTTRIAHSLDFIERSTAQIRNQEAMPLGIFVDGVVAGGVGMHDWQRDINRVQIGYWIARGYEGQGIVTRAVAALCNYLFTRAGINKLEIRYVPANLRSAKVAQRLGFRIEGIIRKGILHNGMAEDLVIAGMLRQEWKMP